MSERWKPKLNETYYVIDSIGYIGGYGWRDDLMDRTYYKNGNCFRTRAKAEAAAEKVKALLLSLHEPVTDCNQLPKLTAEVFDRLDCPVWANWAAVNKDGSVRVFEFPPKIVRTECWNTQLPFHPMGGLLTKFDSSDWQNSLIERPVKENKLPDWCKVGEWCYCLDDDGNGKYFEITTIKDNCIYGEDWDIDYHFVKQARLRPYNAEEMKALLGKVVTEKEHDYYAYLVTAYTAKLDGKNLVAVAIDDAWIQADDVLKLYTIDNAPCGVLEHKNENGEWIE